MMKIYTYIRLIVTAFALLCCQAAIAGEIAGQSGNDVKEDVIATKEDVIADSDRQSKVIKGFCGGMMAHTGWQFGGDNPRGFSPKGVTFGLGGVAKLQFTRHFRAGFEGYFSTVGLKKEALKGSHNKIFWAGGLVDWFWQKGRFYPFVGVGVGGGMETSLYMFKGDKSDWEPEPEVIYRKQPFGYIDPFVGCDFAVGKALRLTLKADWLTAINNEGLNRPLGPRVYFGIIFAR